MHSGLRTALDSPIGRGRPSQGALFCGVAARDARPFSRLPSNHYQLDMSLNRATWRTAVLRLIPSDAEALDRVEAQTGRPLTHILRDAVMSHMVYITADECRSYGYAGRGWREEARGYRFNLRPADHLRLTRRAAKLGVTKVALTRACAWRLLAEYGEQPVMDEPERVRRRRGPKRGVPA